MRRKVTGWLAGLPRRASRASGTIASASALIVCGGAAVGAGALGWGSDQPGGVRWENAPRLLAGYALEITRDPAGTTKVALRLPDADGGEIGLLPLWPVGFIPISLPSTGMRPA